MASVESSDLPPVLAEMQVEIEEYARGHGLDFFPTIFEYIDADQLNAIAANASANAGGASPSRTFVRSQKYSSATTLRRSEIGVLSEGDAVTVTAGDTPTRLLIVAGKPLGEPVARHGPFVMNTREELMQAFVDFQQGRF
jgi:hypothetical protein